MMLVCCIGHAALAALAAAVTAPVELALASPDDSPPTAVAVAEAVAAHSLRSQMRPLPCMLVAHDAKREHRCRSLAPSHKCWIQS